MDTVLTILVIFAVIAGGWPLLIRYQWRRGRRRYQEVLAYRAKYEPPPQTVAQRNAERYAELQRLARTSAPTNAAGSALSRSVAQKAAAEQRKNAQAWLDAITLHHATLAELDALVVDAAAELRRLDVPRSWFGDWPRQTGPTPSGWLLEDIHLEIFRDGSQYRGRDARKARLVGAEIDIPEYNTQNLQPPALDPPLPWAVGAQPGSGLPPWYKDRVEDAIIKLARSHGCGP